MKEKYQRLRIIRGKSDWDLHLLRHPLWCTEVQLSRPTIFMILALYNMGPRYQSARSNVHSERRSWLMSTMTNTTRSFATSHLLFITEGDSTEFSELQLAPISTPTTHPCHLYSYSYPRYDYVLPLPSPSPVTTDFVTAWHYLLDFKLKLLLGLQPTCIFTALAPSSATYWFSLLPWITGNRRSTLLSGLWFAGSLVWFVCFSDLVHDEKGCVQSCCFWYLSKDLNPATTVTASAL